MFKRILSVALAIVMVMAMAAVAVSAAEVSNSAGADATSEATGTSGKIYFDASKWNNVTQIYCHIWINGGDQFYGWKSAEEKCTNVSGSLWEYDLSKLDGSSYITGGLKANEDYCLIFHADTGLQGYDTTFGTECIGDRAYLTGKTIENPVDSEKLGYETVWSKNSSKYGPHFAISSIGNFLGTVLCPNESSTKVIGDWLITYSDSQYCDPVEVLADALPKFGVKDVTTVMAYIMTQDLGISSADKMQSQLEDAYKAAYGEEVTIDTTEVEKKKEEIKNNGGSTAGISADEPSESASSTGSSGSTGASSGSNSSGTGSDGQNDTILFVLAAIMLVSAGAFVVTRKRAED